MTEKRPTWATPARLDGLPVTNWTRRTGVTFAGTLAQCVERWLSLPMHNKRDATLGWGPNADGDFGNMNDRSIASFVLFNGIPPDMAARQGGQPPPERLTEMVSLATPWRAEPPRGPFHDAAPIGQGWKGSDGK